MSRVRIIANIMPFVNTKAVAMTIYHALTKERGIKVGSQENRRFFWVLKGG